MSLFQKILIGVFAVLLIVIAVEIGLFLGYQSVPKTTETKTPAVSSSPQITYDPNQALDWTSIISLSYPRKGLLYSTKMINRYKGEIVELDTKGGFTGRTKFAYKLKIKIYNKQNFTQSFYYNEDDLEKIVITLIDKDKEIPADYRKLVIGDTIILEESLNLTKPWDKNVEKVDVRIIRS